VSDLVRRSVRFGLSISCKACTPSGRLIGLYANKALRQQQRHGTEIVNPTALDAPTQELAVWALRPDFDGIARMAST
jgi:hypothetical protein